MGHGRGEGPGCDPGSLTSRLRSQRPDHTRQKTPRSVTRWRVSRAV